MSFVSHVLSRRYMRVILALNVFFFLSWISQGVTSNMAARASSHSFEVMDVQHTSVADVGQVAGVSDTRVASSGANVPHKLHVVGATTATTSRAGISPEPTVEPDDHKPKKDSYIVAVYGDSMVDTMGDGLPYLDRALAKKYPSTKFTLYNYGMGAQNVEDGLKRWDKPYKYGSRVYPSVVGLEPDIIILGSFAYNPFEPYDRDRHWLGLTKLIERAKDTHADVYLLAEIAPLRATFGQGPQGVRMDTATAYEHSGHIIKQLENAVGLSKNLNVTLVNAYEKSLTNNHGEGKQEYVSLADGIHPSIKGHEFTADEIVKSLVLY